MASGTKHFFPSSSVQEVDKNKSTDPRKTTQVPFFLNEIKMKKRVQWQDVAAT